MGFDGGYEFSRECLYREEYETVQKTLRVRLPLAHQPTFEFGGQD